MKKYILILIAFFALTISMQAQEVPEDNPKDNIENVISSPQNVAIIASVTDIEAQEVYNKTYKDLLDIAEVIIQKAKEKESPKDINWWEILGLEWTALLGILGSLLVWARVPTKYANPIMKALQLILSFIFKDAKKGGGSHNQLK